jgi:hypothetical protein
MFDLDAPGLYMRRIKNVSLTIPCVTGPYTGVHCRLTLIGTTTRIDPTLRAPAHECCCPSEPCGCDCGEADGVPATTNSAPTIRVRAPVRRTSGDCHVERAK